MAEDPGKEEKFDLSPELEGYISLDEARVLALQHARDNREVYGRYADAELVFDVVDAGETLDFYEVTLSFLPPGNFRAPGTERITVNKAGPIELRQVLSQPVPVGRSRALVASVAVVVVAVIAVIAVVAVIATRSSEVPSTAGVEVGLSVASVALTPDAAAELIAPDGDVTVSISPNTVDVASNITYSALEIADIPTLPPGFTATGKAFDISADSPLLKPITITVELNAAETTLAGGDGENISIQHHHGGAWETLPTTVDFTTSKATAEVSQLSVFALAVKQPESTGVFSGSVGNVPTPTQIPTPIPTVTPEPTAVATPEPTPSLVPAATAVPTPSPVPTAVNLLQKPTPAPTTENLPTPTPTPTTENLLQKPTPTPILEPGYTLSINGSQVRSGQLSVSIPNGTVDLYQLTRTDAAYNKGSYVNVEVVPINPLSTVTLVSGFYSTAGATGTIFMDGDKAVVVSITPPSTVLAPTPTLTPVQASTPTPVPTATAVPTPTPTPIPGSTPTPVPTATAVPTPTPTAIPPTPAPVPTATPTAVPTPTPAPTPTPTPTPTATPTPTPTPTSGAVFVSKWGSEGVGNGEFNHPNGGGLASDGSVYVADTNNHRIQKFDSEGVFISQWGTEGTGDGQFEGPSNVAVASDGSVYVTDMFKIQKFTSTGLFVSRWGTGGSGDGEFSDPMGIGVGPDGNVYVADRQNPRIQKFTSEGVFIKTWGAEGTGDGQFRNPRGVAVSSDGSVYVADTSNNRIQKFTSEGAFVTKWGTLGIGDGQFNTPRGVSVAPDGSVYVADDSINRIQKFTSEGVFISKWGTFGTGDGEFWNPFGVAVAPDGIVYVADTVNYRIQKFSMGQ